MVARPSLALEFFNRIKQASDRFAFLAALVNSSPPTFECDWLDFKIGDDPAIKDKKRLEEEQKRVWSKALSAMANSGGGVLVWGIKAEKDKATGIDAANALALVPDVHQFVTRLQELHRQATDPPVLNVDYLPVPTSDTDRAGLVACLIPDSPYKPHRAEFVEGKPFFVRAGDNSAPASVALLRSLFYPSANSELTVEFAHLERDESLGIQIAWDAEFCEMPSMESIPDLSRQSQRHPFLNIDFSAMQFDPMNRVNEDFYRELANYEFVRRLFRPVRLLVKNTGQVAAKNVRAELTVPTDIGVMVLDASEMPDPPERKASIVSQAVMKGIRPAFRREPGEVNIEKNDHRFRIEIDCGDLQPGRWIKSDEFFVGKGQTGDLVLAGQVFAENLPQPKGFSLTVAVNVTNTKMTVSELRSLPEPAED